MKIGNYPCEIKWKDDGRTESLIITIKNFEKVKGLTTDREYVKQILKIK